MFEISTLHTAAIVSFFLGVFVGGVIAGTAVWLYMRRRYRAGIATQVYYDRGLYKGPK